MTAAERLRTILRKHPHWCATRVAKEMRLTRNNVSVIATTNGISFMSREEVENMVDALTARVAELEAARGQA